MDLGLDAPGLGGPGVPVVPAQVGVDRPVLLGMASVVGAVEGEPAERLELALDEVEPARVGRQEDELDVVAGDPREQLPLLVRAEVVEHHDEVLGEAGAQRAQQLAHLAPGLGGPDVAVEPARRGVVGGQQVADTGGPRVRRPEPARVPRAMPAVPEPRLEVQGSELVEAEHPRTRRRVRVQVEDAVLLGLEVGVGRGLPGLVVGEADALLAEDPPQLAAADRRDHPPLDRGGRAAWRGSRR